MFKDPESDQLIFSAQLEGGKLGLPSWLMFHSANQTFVGFPEYVEVLNVRVLAIDSYGSQSSTSFIINITNNAPQVVIS